MKYRRTEEGRDWSHHHLCPKNKRLQEEKANKGLCLPYGFSFRLVQGKRVASERKGELGAPTLGLQVFSIFPL